MPSSAWSPASEQETRHDVAAGGCVVSGSWSYPAEGGYRCGQARRSKRAFVACASALLPIQSYQVSVCGSAECTGRRAVISEGRALGAPRRCKGAPGWGGAVIQRDRSKACRYIRRITLSEGTSPLFAPCIRGETDGLELLHTPLFPSRPRSSASARTPPNILPEPHLFSTMSNVKAQFDKAVAIVKDLPSDGPVKPSQDEQLQVGALPDGLFGPGRG